MRPKVFAMEEGRTLPHGSLVTEGVSVVKLHGGTHSLLLDERLDRPLGPDYLSRFDQLVGDDPFLLVIGCSGGDYRLTSLVDHVLAQAPRTAPKGDPVERVAWLHFESYWPAPLVANPDSKPEDQKLKDGVLAARTTQPSSALTYLYSFMTSRYPASNHTYPSGAGHALAYARRVDPPRVGDVADLFARKNLAGEEEKVFLLSTIKLTELDGGADKAVRAGAASDPTPHTGRAPAGDVNKEFPMVTASDALLDVAHYGLNYGYTPILINLEAVNTLSGLVGTIVDSCRQCDTALVPSVLPSEDHAQTGEARAHLLSKAVALVANALQRSRYVVLLDGLETYLWNATSHHGETTTQNADPENRFRLLCAFIQNLRAAQGHEPLPFAPAGGRAAGAAPGAPSPAVPKVNDIGESRIVIGLDQRVPRNEHSGRVPQIGAVLKQSGFDQLPELHLGAEIQAHLRFTDFFVPADYLHAQTIWPGSDTGAQRDTLGLLLLVACRRARPLALVRHLLRPVFNRPDAIDAFLRQLTENRSGAFVTLEGGVTWISRPVRDHLYTEATRYTSTRSMRTLLGGGDLKDLEKCIVQLTNIYAVHVRISRTYYVYTFRQSNDAAAFLEYTYHRISTLRYLVKLIAVLVCANRNTGTAERVRSAFRNLGRFWRSVGSDMYLNLVRRFRIREGTELYTALDPTGTEAAAAVDSNKSLIGALRVLHAKESGALLRAWQRHEPTLRRQLPPQQLLHWCDRLADDDLPYRCDRVVTDYNDSGVPTPPPERVVISPALSTFRTLLRDLRVKLLAERGDYERVVEERYEDLRRKSASPNGSPLGERVAEIADVIVSRGEPPQLGRKRAKRFHTRLHGALDVLNALMKRVADPKRDLAVLRLFRALTPLQPGQGGKTATGAPEVNEDADLPQLQPLGRDREPQFEHPCRHEAVLRYFHLRAEFDLRYISVFACGFNGAPEGLAGIDTDRALAAVDCGAEENRRQLQARAYLPRSVVIDRGPDGTLYPQYGTVFNSLRARAFWIQVVQQAGTRDPADEDPTFRLAFQTAFRYFELAKGGLQGTNPLLQAYAELYQAEACLGIARFHLHRAGPASEPNGAPAPEIRSALVAEVRSKHETARGCLRRAGDLLLRSRRNVVWWRLYYTLIAQYHADRLLVALVGRLREWSTVQGQAVQFFRRQSKAPETAEERQRFWADARAVVEGSNQFAPYRGLPETFSRLRRGYNALRRASEFRLDRALNDPWLLGIESQLTRVGVALGFTAACQGRAGEMPAEGARTDTTSPPTEDELYNIACEPVRMMRRLERLAPSTAANWREPGEQPAEGTSPQPSLTEPADTELRGDLSKLIQNPRDEDIFTLTRSLLTNRYLSGLSATIADSAAPPPSAVGGDAV